MSFESVIDVVNLSKCYRIYDNPSDRLKQVLFRGRKHFYKEFWALKNVSFRVEKGETVGIVGRNGSGKSTLLQMICGTLKPSSGEIKVQGRIAALLELGSGFNPEFTGRENVYMNASLLGLSKNDIDEKLQKILEFADIGDFIDRPVKTYSSGMYVRLAFSVIVHVDANVLVVDEALAVGDMYFQAKCMEHLKSLVKSGVTILFVSHDINAVKALCSSAIYLENGKVVSAGPTQKVVDAYFQSSIRGAKHYSADDKLNVSNENREFKIDQENFKFRSRANFQRVQNGLANFLDVVLLDDSQKELLNVSFGQLVTLRMVIKINEPNLQFGLGYHIRDKNGCDLIYSDTAVEGVGFVTGVKGDVWTIDWNFSVTLQPGDYTVVSMLSVPKDLEIGLVDVCDYVPLSYQFKVDRGNNFPIYGAVRWKNQIELRKYDF